MEPPQIHFKMVAIVLKNGISLDWQFYNFFKLSFAEFTISLGFQFLNCCWWISYNHWILGSNLKLKYGFNIFNNSLEKTVSIPLSLIFEVSLTFRLSFTKRTLSFPSQREILRKPSKIKILAIKDYFNSFESKMCKH